MTMMREREKEKMQVNSVKSILAASRVTVICLHEIFLADIRTKLDEKFDVYSIEMGEKVN